MGLISMAIRLVDRPTKARLGALEATQLNLASKLVTTQQSVHNLHAASIIDKAIDRHHQSDEVIGDTQQHAAKVGHTQHQAATVGVMQHQAASVGVMQQNAVMINGTQQPIPNQSTTPPPVTVTPNPPTVHPHQRFSNMTLPLVTAPSTSPSTYCHKTVPPTSLPCNQTSFHRDAYALQYRISHKDIAQLACVNYHMVPMASPLSMNAP